MTEEDTENTQEEAKNNYTCERCGFVYRKVFDYAPFLCYRCLRYIGKGTYKIMHTLTPPTSTTQKPED